jgi:hypothetical protein
MRKKKKIFIASFIKIRLLLQELLGTERIRRKDDHKDMMAQV